MALMWLLCCERVNIIAFLVLLRLIIFVQYLWQSMLILTNIIMRSYNFVPKTLRNGIIKAANGTLTYLFFTIFIFLLLANYRPNPNSNNSPAYSTSIIIIPLNAFQGKRPITKTISHTSPVSFTGGGKKSSCHLIKSY